MPTPSNETPKDGLGRVGVIGIFVIPMIVVIAVVAMMTLDPRVATHISDAVEAEFGTTLSSASAQPPPLVHVVKAK